MDEQNIPQPEQEPQQPQDILSHKPTVLEKYPFIKWLLPLFVLILIGAIGGLYLAGVQNKQSAIPQPTPTLVPSPTPDPIAEKEALIGKGYPITKWIENTNTRKLSIYPFFTGKLTETDIIVDAGGGGVGFGDADPVVSPDLKYTAYVDNETNNLWLLTNETLEKQKIITKDGRILISGWSPDSKKIVFFVYEGSFQGGIITDKPGLGFYLYDKDSGKSNKLPIDSFVSFIDNQRILVNSFDQPPKDHLIVFDIESFKESNDIVTDHLVQISITDDGKYWTYTYSYSDNSDKSMSRIIYAKFPDKEGTVIAQGGFADVQFPKISPRGTKIAYIKKAKDSKNFVDEVVWVYDTEEKTNKRFVDGRPENWANENILIFSTFDGSGGINGASKYYYINIDTGKTVEMI